MATKTVVVGHGNNVSVTGTLSVGFIVSVNDLRITATNTSTSNVRIHLNFWTLTDASNNVITTQTGVDFDYTVSAAGSYNLSLAVTNKFSIVGSTNTTALQVGSIVIPDITAPAVPTGVTVVTHSDTEISGTYTTHPNTDGDLYEVVFELRDSLGTTVIDSAHYLAGSGLATDPLAVAPTWSFTGTFAPGDYNVYAKASDQTNVSAYTAAVPVNVANPALPQPGSLTLTATVVGPSSMTLSWTASTNATTYQVEYGPAGGGFPNVLEVTTGLTATLGGLLPSTSYDVRVQACNSNHVPPDGTFSNTETKTTNAQGSNNAPAGFTTLLNYVPDPASPAYVDRYFGYNAPAVIPTANYIQGPYTFGEKWQLTWSTLNDAGIKNVTDATSPTGAYVEKHWTAGVDHGFEGQIVYRFGLMRKLYYRFVIWYSPNWGFMPDKITYFGSQSGNAVTANYFGWKSDHSFGIRFQSSGAGTTIGADGASEFRSNHFFATGVWHTIEVLIHCQSAPGVADAKFWAWANGNALQLIMNKTGNPHNGQDCTGVGLEIFGSGTTSTDKLKYGGGQMWEYWGGTFPQPLTETQYARIGEIFISGEPA